MKQFTITQLLLFVTWCGIGAFVLARVLATPPYQGHTHDIEGTTFYHYGVDDEQVTTTLDEDAVARTPPWPAADPNPPLSARKALSIADQFRRERLRDKNNWEWGLDSLTLYPLLADGNKWCWSVDFTAYPKTGGLGGRPPSISVFVLMNGEVVVPNEAEDLAKWGIVENESTSGKPTE